jgi:Protein of unknown function (DUF4058)
MKSPFPGMDPYLEAHWGDVHNSLTTYTRNQLQRQLPGDLRARVEEQILVEDEEFEGRPKRWKPDVRVVEKPNGDGHRATSESGVALAEPIVIEFDEDPEIQRSVRIIDTRSGNRLVTSIEILSPTNKTDPLSRRAFLQKRRELRAGGVSCVEIDLIRAGDSLGLPPSVLPVDYRAPCGVTVMRGWEAGRAELYGLPLRERLPSIRVPLRETDSDVFLDIQALLEAAYQDGAYDDIDYTQDPDPPLSPEDAAWADELLRKQGKR